MQLNEIFTYHKENQTKISTQAIKKKHCRFLNTICSKQNCSTSYPMGICSVTNHQKQSIICPHRFLEDNIVFKDICYEIWGSIDNVVLFSEVQIQNVGNFDFVLVKHKPFSSQIDDFCIVEFQPDSITEIGSLTKAVADFVTNKSKNKDYDFELNTLNTIKFTYHQMVTKGKIIEKWNKHIVWVLQKYVYDDMVRAFSLPMMNYTLEKKTKCFLYDLEKKGTTDRLVFQEKTSATVSNLLMTPHPIPDLYQFIHKLEMQIRLSMELKFT